MPFAGYQPAHEVFIGKLREVKWGHEANVTVGGARGYHAGQPYWFGQWGGQPLPDPSVPLSGGIWSSRGGFSKILYSGFAAGYSAKHKTFVVGGGGLADMGELYAPCVGPVKYSSLAAEMYVSTNGVGWSRASIPTTGGYSRGMTDNVAGIWYDNPSGTLYASIGGTRWDDDLYDWHYWQYFPYWAREFEIDDPVTTWIIAKSTNGGFSWSEVYRWSGVFGNSFPSPPSISVNNSIQGHFNIKGRTVSANIQGTDISMFGSGYGAVRITLEGGLGGSSQGLSGGSYSGGYYAFGKDPNGNGVVIATVGNSLVATSDGTSWSTVFSVGGIHFGGGPTAQVLESCGYSSGTFYCGVRGITARRPADDFRMMSTADAQIYTSSDGFSWGGGGSVNVGVAGVADMASGFVK